MVMSSMMVLATCGVVSLALSVLFVAVLFTGRRPINRRRHELGRLLSASHPEWN